MNRVQAVTKALVLQVHLGDLADDIEEAQYILTFLLGTLMTRLIEEGRPNIQEEVDKEIRRVMDIASQEKPT